MKIDLNADLGEGCANDQALLQLVSSANIACGFHAGDAQTMRQSVRWALGMVWLLVHIRASRIGKTLVALLCSYHLRPSMLKWFINWARLPPSCRLKGVMQHVKPHGMLYNQAAVDPLLADAIAQAVKAVDPSLRLVGLAGSELIRAGTRVGLVTRQEVFADRHYQPDGTLVPRSQPDALIESDELALSQTLAMVQQHQVQACDGSWVQVQADTVCVHGDGVQALAFARCLRDRFQQEGISVIAQ